MTLSCKISYTVNATYTGARGRVSGSGSLFETNAIALNDGTAAGEADGLFSASPELTAGDIHAYALADGLVDLYGATLDFSAIKLILIEADLGNAANLVIGGGSWAGPFGDASSTVDIKPGCAFMLACQDAIGWVVPDDADELLLTSSADASYGLVLVGVSSAISAPAFAVQPAIVGIPTVGVPCTCTDGDWSGNPVFAYAWKRGGTTIVGATGATYTPLPGDVGKALVRVSTASNIAGGVNVPTAPVTVVAGAPVVVPLGDIGLSNDLSIDGLANH